MIGPDRIRCEVLGCRRTASRAKHGDCRIICGKCWRLGSVEARRAYSAAHRALRRLGDGPALAGDLNEAAIQLVSQQMAEVRTAERAAHDAWERVRIEASESKAGLA